MRRIAVITGSRSEYGLLYWIIKGIHEDPDLELLLLVTGMHLSPEFGLTVREIEKDGFPIAGRVELLLSSDTEAAIATSMGIGMIGFAKEYERLKPDIVLVLGDRFETLSAVAAAVPFRTPVAHIHGGEATEGAMDELFRHAITKMSHIHFAAAERYRERIIQMGEDPRHVFCFGAPGLDSIYEMDFLDKAALLKELGVSEGKRLGVVTYHPVTLEKHTAGRQIRELLEALASFPDMYWIFTMPNADTGGRIIIKRIRDFTGKNSERGKDFISLGRVKYLSLLRHAQVMVGNSSSGLIEAPSFRLPVVNIGDRQRGRVCAKNVINVADCRRAAIENAVQKALSDGFKTSLRRMKNPYGAGNASKRIVKKLKSVKSPGQLIRKSFHEIKS